MLSRQELLVIQGLVFEVFKKVTGTVPCVPTAALMIAAEKPTPFGVELFINILFLKSVFVVPAKVSAAELKSVPVLVAFR